MAAPATAGAATRARSTPSTTPSIRSAPPRGTTRTAKRVSGVPTAGVYQRPWGRSPNSARPTRTIVAPSSTATSKSSVMPIDSSAPRPRAPARSRSPTARAGDEGRPGRLRVGDQPADRHQAVGPEPRQVQEPPDRRPRAPRDRSRPSPGRRSTLTWSSTGSGGRPDLAPRSGPAAGRARPSRRTGSTSNDLERPPRPCSTGAAR